MESTLAVQSIPLSKIKPNTENPRHVITTEMIDSLAASLSTAGLKNPIKVQSLKREKGEKVKTGPESDFEYELVSGHIRLEAAKKLGWEAIPAIVMALTPDQAELVAILDNQGEDMHWLDWYQAIEKRWNRHPNPTQRKIADELGVSPMTVNRALKVTGFLTPAARQMLVTDCYKNPGPDQVSETAVRALMGLVEGSSPTPQAQALIEKALEVVISKRMTEPEVAEMVKNANNSGQPGEEALSGTDSTGSPRSEVAATHSTPPGRPGQGDSHHSDMGGDPYSNYWKDIPKEIKVKKTRKGYRVVMELTPGLVVPIVYAAKARLDAKKAYEGEKTKNGTSGKVEGDKGEKGIGGRNPIPKVFSPKESDKWQPAPTGFLGKIKQALGDHLKVTPEALGDNLAKDAKQAVNYQIRRGMRNILRDMF